MTKGPVGILASEQRHVVDALQRLIGAPVLDAWVPEPTLVVLSIGRELLRIEHAPVPRVHTVPHRPRSPATPLSFQGLLRARFTGPLRRLDVVGEDRIVELAVDGRVLHARLFGRGRGGIWLVEDGVVVASASGPAPPDLAPLPDRAPPWTAPRFSPGPDADWDLAARGFLGALAADHAEHVARRMLLGRLSERLVAARRRVEHLTSDLAGAERSTLLRRQADALSVVLHTVRRGATAADVVDLEDPAVVHHVPLDPGRAPSDGLRRLYERAARLDRAADDVLERLTLAESEVTSLAADLAEASTAARPALDALGKKWPERARRAEDAPSLPYRTWTGPRGKVLRVGKDARSNHALVFRHARGRDWWVHVRGRPGCHVVLPMPQRGDVPSLDDLLVAAQVAMIASGVRVGEACDVQYARVADLRAVPGSPGKVIVRDERVLHVRREALTGWTVSDG